MKIVGKLPEPKSTRSRRGRLRSLAFAPTLMTLGNLLCGFAAIHFALRAMYELGAGQAVADTASLDPSLLERMLPSFLSIGAGLVIVGMVFDLFDGLLARATRSTTNFGGQLDSLADVVTFGVAPATLMVAVMTGELARDSILPSPISAHFVGRMAWVCAAVYVAFTAVRLARFNVEHDGADSDYRMFRGMPSPGAAAVMASLVFVQDQLSSGWRTAMIYAMPLVAVVIAFLMVSRVPYRRFHHTYLLGKRPFGQFVMFVLLAAVFFLFKAPTLLALVLWYAASGPIFELVRYFRGRGASPADETDTGDTQITSNRKLA